MLASPVDFNRAPQSAAAWFMYVTKLPQDKHDASSAIFPAVLAFVWVRTAIDDLCRD